MTAPIAFISDYSSLVAFVFDGVFSAVRDQNGKWSSPAPAMKPSDFSDGYNMLDAKAAKTLYKEAQIALISDECEFFDVEGIPVTIGAGDLFPYCAAWDASPPREFDPSSARRNGNPISKSNFSSLLKPTLNRSRINLKEWPQKVTEEHVDNLNRVAVKDSIEFQSFMKKITKSENL